MKALIQKILATTAIAFSIHAHAQIPVTDAVQIGTVISNEVEQMAKWAQQFQQLQQQIQQYEQQFKAITGARGMGNLLNNPAIKTALPQDWQNLLTQVKTTAAYATNRQKYPTLPNQPKANEMYDVIASQQAVMDDLYTKTNQRVQQIQDLMGQIDSADDPAAKMDLTNRLISEQNAVQANQNLVTILQSKQQQEIQAAAEAAQKEYACKEFKRAC
jgi:type IV secretion system protein VirB5